jgi:[ribosomal protein S5]-alanine N-acetyltransferase
MSLEMPILETQRLVIRPFQLDDLDAAYHVLDEDAEPREAILSERRAWLEWSVRNYPALSGLYQPPYGDRAITLKADGALVGAVGLVPCLGPFGLLPYYAGRIPPQEAGLSFPEVGLFWALDRAQRGRGYATEAAQALIEYAFRELKLARIIATTEFDNHASQRVMQRLGMRIESNPHPELTWFHIVGILENRGSNNE